VCATAVLFALGGWSVFRALDGAGAPSPDRSAASSTLPTIALDTAAARAVTKIELTQPQSVDEDPHHHSVTITAVTSGQDDGWAITSPIRTRASASKVVALLDNLKDVSVRESIDRGATAYDLYQLTDAEALHVVVWDARGKVRDLYFGRSDARGQLIRIAGTDGVFAIPNSGPHAYSGFLFTRGLRSWRDAGILEFEEDAAVEVEVTNRSGRLDFTKDDGGWSGSIRRRARDGILGDPEPRWPGFDATKVDALVRAYRSLSADDFGDDRQRAGSGVDDAERTGGVIRIRLKGARGDRVVRVGNPSTNTGRWAIKESRWAILQGGDGTLYALAPWTADWATAGESQFESRHAP
jgi:hypothetical protein